RQPEARTNHRTFSTNRCSITGRPPSGPTGRSGGRWWAASLKNPGGIRAPAMTSSSVREGYSGEFIPRAVGGGFGRGSKERGGGGGCTGDGPRSGRRGVAPRNGATRYG